MLQKIGKTTGAEVIAGCPGVGRSAILAAVKRLVEEGEIVKCGAGKNTYYVRKDAVEE